MIQISSVKNASELRQFIDFPHKLYKNDVNYVPELFIAQRDLLTKHPFHKHSKLEMFLAKRKGVVCGRIAAIRNNNYINFTKDTRGFFGFFDVENDVAIASILMNTAKEWIKKENLTGIIGPVNFSTNETAGLLIDGFDSPPVIMTTYNPAYYPSFMDLIGMEKMMDLLAYKVNSSDVSQKAIRISETLEERLNKRGITIRKVNLKNFKEETQQLRNLYNDAWEKNWGFVPMTDEEFDYLAKDLKLIVDPDFAFVAEHNNQVIGFSLTLPDLNYALRKVKNGRLLPFGIFQLLLNKGKAKMARVLALGVSEAYRKIGIEACFYAKTIQAGVKKNIHTAEASWILENNTMMNQALENMNGKVYKKYRIYKLDF